MTEEPYLRRLIAPPTHGLLAVLGGAAFVLLASVFVHGGPLPALLLALVMGVGLAFRYTLAPTLAVLMFCYFQFAPLGVPSFFDVAGPLRNSAFRLTDLLAALALVVYLAAQYRLYALLDRAVPDEHPKTLNPPPPPRRTDRVTDLELVQLVAAAGVSVLLGQVGWMLLTNLELRFDDMPPVRFYRGFRDPDVLSRIGLLLFAGAAWVIAGRTAFGLWRQARYTAAEGRQVLLDVGWQEVRREAARQAVWRAWPTRPRVRRTGGVGWVFLVLLVGLLVMVGFSLGVWVLLRLR